MRYCFVLCCAVFLAASPAAAKCKKGERLVPTQSPIFGGPGLGFETVEVTSKSSCFPVLQTSPDGSFALIQFGDEKAGWVATGLVDASLSEAKDVEEIAVADTAPRVVVRETALRASPRFDADALEILAASTSVTVLATTPDGQWYKVTATDKKVEGWIVRFATAEKAVEAGSAPTAGTGKWAVSVGPKEPTRVSETTPIPPKKAVTPTPATDETKAATDGVVVAPTPVQGRTSALYFGLGVQTWVEQYRSDAVGDVYHAYDLQSLGGGFFGGYAFRSSANPFVLDVRARASVSPFSAFEIGTPDPVLIIAALGSASSYVGWRVHQSETVDVDMGFTPATSTIFNPGFGEGSPAAGAFATSVFVDVIRPTVNARSRMGNAGMMTLEVSATLGTMLYLPDPGATYEATSPNDRPPLPLAPQAPVDETPVDPAAEPDPALATHFVVGANGRIQYSYAFTDGLFVDVGADLGIRQAVVGGPGLRTGAYLQANQLDLVASVFAGMTFGL